MIRIMAESVCVGSIETRSEIHRAQVLLINREAVGHRLHPLLYGGLNHRRLAVRRLPQRVEDFRDQHADLLEFGDAEATRGCRRCTEAKSRRLDSQFQW